MGGGGGAKKNKYLMPLAPVGGTLPVQCSIYFTYVAINTGICPKTKNQKPKIVRPY
jgi:hypothetical protein